jgi:hypothetical protein
MSPLGTETRDSLSLISSSAPATPPLTSDPTDVGTQLGRRMAVSIRGDGLAFEFLGLEALDPDFGDPLGRAGIEPGTPTSHEVEAAAEAEYRRVMVEVR